MAILALPVFNDANNSFPEDITSVGADFQFNFTGRSWQPFLDTNLITITIDKNASYPVEDILGGKLFFFDEYNIGKRVISNNSYPYLRDWKPFKTLTPKPVFSINYYGNSNMHRPVDGFSFIHPTNGSFSIGKTISGYPTFSEIYAEPGCGWISYQDYQANCSNKNNNWLHPIMEKVPNLIQNKQMPKTIEDAAALPASWKVMWRSYDINAGSASCVIMSLVYGDQVNMYREYYDYIYPYEQLLGLFIPDFALNGSTIELAISA